MKPTVPGQPKKMNMPSLQQFVDQQMEYTGEDEFQRRRRPIRYEYHPNTR